MLVVDASALTDLLIGSSAAPSVATHLLSAHPAAPHIVDLEVLNALRRRGASDRLSAERADDAVRDLIGLPIKRYPHALLLSRIWSLRDNFNAYDAAYLALAEVLADEGVPLLTTDARFARAARKHSDVEILLAA